MGLALFDLDYTLLAVNSGQLWVRSEWRAGNLSLRDLIWAGWWLMRYQFGHQSGLDEVFRTAAQGLQGQSEADLDERVRVWFAAEVQQHLRPAPSARWMSIGQQETVWCSPPQEPSTRRGRPPKRTACPRLCAPSSKWSTAALQDRSRRLRWEMAKRTRCVPGRSAKASISTTPRSTPTR